MPEDVHSRADRRDAVPLGQFIKDVLAQHPSFASKPLGDWKELVGEHVARHCVPRSLKDGVLLVVARDNVWKHHLELNKEALVQRINEQWGRRVVLEVRIRVGEVENADEALEANYRKLQKVTPKRSRTRKKKVAFRKLTKAEKELVASLPDRELQKMAERLLRLTPAEPSQTASEES